MTSDTDRVGRGAQGILALLVLAFAVSTVPGVRSHPGFSVSVDGWLQGTAYVGCAVVAARSAHQAGRDRRMWSLVALALGLRALGFVLYLAHVRLQVPQPYPSVADAAWLAMAVVLVLALGALVRAQVPRLSVTLALDGLMVALTVAGAAISMLSVLLADLIRPGMALRVELTNLAYPVLDAALLVVVVGVLAAVAWRPGPRVALLVVGVLGFAVGDTVFLYVVSTGAYRPGTWLAALSLVATAVMASAGSLSERPTEPRTSNTAPGLTAPVLFALVSVSVLAYASLVDVPLAGVFLSVAALLVAMARAVLTLLGDRAVASAELDIASEDLVRFRALVEASRDFIGMAHPDSTMIYLNPAGREMVGIGLDVDVTGTRVSDYLEETARENFVQRVRPAVLEAGAWQGETRLRDQRGGPPIQVEASTFLVRRPDGEPFVLGTVQRDLTDRLAARRALQDLADQREELLRRLVQAQEDERASIAEDVHDDSVQVLAAVDLRLGLLRRQLEERAPDLIESVDTTLLAVSEATRRLRNLLFDLESPAQHTGLAAALEAAATFVFEASGEQWTITGDLAADLPTPSRITAYRIAKEALVNVRRHAGARRVEIVLGREEDGIVVTVRDDGCGVHPGQLERQPGHLGIAGMHDRAAVAGGRLEVSSPADGGTLVWMWLPAEVTTARE